MQILTKVFISWSGPRSKVIAEALKVWLPKVIQSVDPWISTQDIDAGAAWMPEISEQLHRGVGILCLSPSNLTAPWILFEAGGLAKTIGKAMVIPYLSGVNTNDLLGNPMSHFNGCKSTYEGTFMMLKSLNKAGGPNAISETVLRETYDKFWPDLESEIARATKEPEEVALHLSSEELLDRLTAEVRANTQAVADLRRAVKEASIFGAASSSAALYPTFGGFPSPGANNAPLYGVAGLSTLSDILKSVSDPPTEEREESDH